MTLNEIRKYIETILNKDESGNTLTPKEFNYLLEAHIFGFVKDQVLAYRQYIASGSKIDDVIFTAMLIDSLQTSTTATLTSGNFTLPTDMLFLNDIYGTYNAHQKRIEVVSHEEYANRKMNMLAKPVQYFPIAYINSTTCTVIPKSMTGINVSYIKKPVTPLFDYYVDANYVIQYLAASATHLLTTGEKGSAGQTSGTTVTSLTAELNIPEELHKKFGDYIIAKVSIRDRDQLMYQANANEQAKS